MTPDGRVDLIVDSISPLSTVSESLLFGLPCVISFNVAKKLDWESFKKNKYTFFSLCKKLAQAKQGIIVHSKQKDLCGTESFPHIRHYYLLVPSDDGCHFLAKVIERGLY